MRDGDTATFLLSCVHTLQRWFLILSADCPRLRNRPDYIKASEFTETGHPHLHVLVFNVLTRNEDGMLWHCDKPEVAAKWVDYG